MRMPISVNSIQCPNRLLRQVVSGKRGDEPMAFNHNAQIPVINPAKHGFPCLTARLIRYVISIVVYETSRSWALPRQLLDSDTLAKILILYNAGGEVCIRE